MAPPASTTIAKRAARTAVAGDSAKTAPKAPTAKANIVTAPKKARDHPPYFEMIKEAIMALKERTGSSQYAIAKFIEENQKDLPSNFKKILLVQLKKLVASGKLTKVKNSFKLSAIQKPTSAASEKPKAAAKAKKESTKKVTAVTGGKKPNAATSGKPKKDSLKTKEPAKKKAAAKGGEENGKKRKAVAAAPKIKKTPVKKPKSIKSPAKKLKK